MHRLALALFLSACAATVSAPRHPSAPRWQPLSRAAFDEAEARHAFVLLSLQADWCHFCHVMNDTTFADAEVREELAAHFVVVREEADRRPDLVARWGLYGWPATIILDASGHELLALRGYREPAAFLPLLRALVSDRDAGRELGSSLPAALRGGRRAASAFEGELSELRAQIEAQVDAVYDPALDGWGTPQKYPFGALVEHALARAFTRGEALWETRALASLERHASLIDPEWGGMYQYSVEGDWDHPHYEKLATLQASALESFAAALERTGDARWRARGREVTRYLGAHLRSPEGTFYVAQDADLRSDTGSTSGAVFYALDATARAALGVEPHVDMHVDADVNGLVIAALARYGFAAEDDEAIAWAITAADAIWASHCAFESGCAHEVDDPRRHLADQAAMLAGLVAVAQVSPPGEGARHLARAAALARVVSERFVDGEGGLRASAIDGAELDLTSGVRPFVPGAIAARALLTLDRFDEGAGHADAARRALFALGDADTLARQGRIVGELLLALDLAIEGTVRFTLVGEPSDPRTGALLAALATLYEPRRVIERALPAASRYGDPGEPAIFVCASDACSLPITEPSALASSVSALLR